MEAKSPRTFRRAKLEKDGLLVVMGDESDF
jgi:hypothetical protein